MKANDDPPLVTILKVRPVYVTFSVPEKYLADVRKHAALGKLAVRAVSRGEDGAGHSGVLTFIDNEVAAATGTIRLRGEFPNEDSGLWPGQFVEIDADPGRAERRRVGSLDRDPGRPAGKLHLRRRRRTGRRRSVPSPSTGRSETSP